MDQSAKNALELLFGGSEDPVCAVSRGLKPVWAPDDRARMLLRCLREELVAASETSEPVLPQDGTVLFDSEKGCSQVFSRERNGIFACFFAGRLSEIFGV